MEYKHTFVICAYKDSPYLEACMESLCNQRVKSKLMLTTSTPSAYIEELCKKYTIEYYVREGEPSIGEDWNYALSKTDTPYVTIAHQDDIYDTEYGERMVAACEGKEDVLIAFSDYRELVGEVQYCNRLNLRIKRMLLRPLRNPKKQNIVGRKRKVLSLGNAICCPCVTYHMKYLRKILREQDRQQLFDCDMRSNLDWLTWEWLSLQPGRFIYIPESLMVHRIHEASETSAVIAEHKRGMEDYAVFCKFWPKWVAKILSMVYGTSEKGNTV